jgi:hypothetical protein
MMIVPILFLLSVGRAAPAPATSSLPVAAAPDTSFPPPTPPFRPASLASCRALGYCNSGSCRLLPDQRVSCTCSPPFVDSAAGLCSVRGKSKAVAVLLSLFFGWSGADWFYLGGGDPWYILGGLLKLATFAIPALWLFGPAIKLLDSAWPVGFAFSVTNLTWWYLDCLAILGDHWDRDAKGRLLFLDW